MRLLMKIGVKMTPAEIAALAYPGCVRTDTEGRTYNRASATVARILRHTRGVIECEHNKFVRIY